MRVSYGADRCNLERRVLTRLEYGSQGVNRRFVVTHGGHDPRAASDPNTLIRHALACAVKYPGSARLPRSLRRAT